METNPLKAVAALGQSVWLDDIRRDLMASGELEGLIQDGVRGMTSNPAIFEKAIRNSRDYDDDIRILREEGKKPLAIYESLSQCDVRHAADAFRPVYDQTDGLEGYVSLEVNPHLAHDTSGTVVEAQHLWRTLDRPNIFIKVPATLEGLPAIQKLISDGINVNVTLIFGLPRYRQVVDAYLAGIEERLAGGQSVKRIASVASFFVSRIDMLVDAMLETICKQGGAEADLAKELLGQAAVSSAKLAYQMYNKLFITAQFLELAAVGAHSQRLLWASTGNKNPDYSDLKYVESLVGRETITTLPMETLRAFKHRGVANRSLEQGVTDSAQVMSRIESLGIDIDRVTQQLEDEGIDKFIQPFDQMMTGLARALPIQ